MTFCPKAINPRGISQCILPRIAQQQLGHSHPRITLAVYSQVIGESADRWDFVGNPKDFTSNQTPIPFFPGPSFPAACVSAANTAALLNSLNQFGCFMRGNSVMIPPAIGTFGTMGRNIFRDSGFRDWDLSVVKNWKFTERLSTQFRAEFFNVLNHPNFANPGRENGAFALTDPSGGLFGCGCATPDVAAANPVLGSGSNRAIQLGLKFIF